MNKIALIGFMGVGKTTIGKILAKLLKYKFLDIDSEIEKLENKTIKLIIQNYGLEYFRKIEQIAFKNIVNNDNNNAIISCGGGIISTNENIQILYNKTTCIWLDASVEYCLQGLNISKRPLLANMQNPHLKAIELKKSRKHLYAKAAHILINAENKSSLQIAKEIYNNIVDTI